MISKVLDKSAMKPASSDAARFAREAIIVEYIKTLKLPRVTAE